MAYGISYYEFWGMNPRIVAVYTKAYVEKQRLRDAEMWHMGKYVFLAVADAVGTWFGGEKFVSGYPERAFLDDSLTKEEIEQKRLEREIQKAIMAEEAWIRYYTRHGVPNAK